MKKAMNPVLPSQFNAGLHFEPCVECGKEIVDGYWGRYNLGNGKDGGVCSKTCSILFMKHRKDDILKEAVGT